MRNSTLTAAAIAAGLGLAASATHAMPVATPDQMGLAEGAAGALERTILFCDPWTCYWRPDPWGYYRSNPYWGWRRHYWWGRQYPTKSLIPFRK